MTHKQFGSVFGFSDKFPPAWANKNTLYSVAEILKSDPQIGLDLTFMIRRSTAGFPSGIDGKPYERKHLVQEQQTRDLADQIIAKFGSKAKNPYR